MLRNFNRFQTDNTAHITVYVCLSCLLNQYFSLDPGERCCGLVIEKHRSPPGIHQPDWLWAWAIGQSRLLNLEFSYHLREMFLSRTQEWTEVALSSLWD